MTLNKLQENLTKKGYTSEEVDVWTAGYVYALNHQPDLKPLVAENEALRERVADANRGAQVNALVNESLAKKLKLAVEALGHYADKSNWDSNKGFANDVWYLTERGWSIADETLTKIKEPSKGRDV